MLPFCKQECFKLSWKTHNATVHKVQKRSESEVSLPQASVAAIAVVPSIVRIETSTNVTKFGMCRNDCGKPADSLK